MSLVVDASVGLKWILDEPDSHLAHALVCGDEDVLIPDFWLNEATNVLWLQVRRNILHPEEARDGLALLRTLIRPVPSGDLELHDIALEIGLAVNHSTYDTLYLAFAVAIGARGLIVADQKFVANMRRHPDSMLVAMMIPLDTWARDNGLG